ncbi:OTU-domain-containing protein [Phanerochaete sordida]|uniref:Ubiquitin thioesterase OTU n=1 Tax=Phanerochaete sordida TaxID=48140 RepID=A0A9P3GAC5_9APHY|nr:OTU-domain-containing protein [Phanerochaete sordida]
MAPIRLRHPKGVTTLQVDLDAFTVLDLQQEIFAVTEIPPSQQELKAGYPPHALTLIPELPLESLGLKAGEQLMVTQMRGATRPPPAANAVSDVAPAAPMTGLTRAQATGPSTPAPAPSAPASGPDYVPTEGGYLVHRIVPDDNSCLFNAIALVFEQDMSKAQQVRKIVAEEIKKDMDTWNEAILGRPREEYITTISKPNTWGGAIELAVLAKHYNTEIASVDVETGRIDKFSPPAESDSGNRCVLVYSGIHYDAATIAPILDAPDDFHQTVVPREGEDADSDPILAAAKKLADKLRAKRAYTNTATFDLRCQICQKGLKGEKEAREHAQQTGHVEFGEY